MIDNQALKIYVTLLYFTLLTTNRNQETALTSTSSTNRN
jgi:hypothetical protein